MHTIHNQPADTPATHQPPEASAWWTEAGPAGQQPVAPPPGTPGTRKPRRAKLAAAAVAAVLLVGGGAAYLAEQSSGSGTGSAATANAAGPQGAFGAQGGAPGGAGTGGLGFQPTAYHLDGTITAIGNGSVTLKTTSGTTTYTVTSATHLSRGGSSSALSAFKVGDSIRASTTTQGGKVLNDMVSGTGTGAAPGAAPGAAA